MQRPFFIGPYCVYAVQSGFNHFFSIVSGGICVIWLDYSSYILRTFRISQCNAGTRNDFRILMILLMVWFLFLLQNSEASLPVCSPNSVCNKLDTYSSPWVEKQCRCPQGMNSCSTSTHIRDGHTITDRNRQYKVSF